MNNLYQVIKEEDVDKILSENPTKLIVISYIIKQPGFYQHFKNFVKTLSKNFSTCYFIVIDLKNYTNTTGKYTTEISQIPKVTMYFNSEILGISTQFDQKEITDTIMQLSTTINEKFKLAQSQKSSNNSENLINIQEKVSHVNNLCTPKNIEELDKIKNPEE